ncbi:MAG TPA: hypothetical protein ENH82_17260 [bacterium]|nr:hypothetical protein [bacterium]
MVGYQTLIKTNVSVSPGRPTEITVQLELAPVEVGTVTIKAKESYFEKDPEAVITAADDDFIHLVAA